MFCRFALAIIEKHSHADKYSKSVKADWGFLPPQTQISPWQGGFWENCGEDLSPRMWSLAHLLLPKIPPLPPHWLAEAAACQPNSHSRSPPPPHLLAPNLKHPRGPVGSARRLETVASDQRSELVSWACPLERKAKIWTFGRSQGLDHGGAEGVLEPSD